MSDDMNLIMEGWREFLSKAAGNYEPQWRMEIKKLLVPGKGLPVTHQTSAANLQAIMKGGKMKRHSPHNVLDAIWFTVGHNENRMDWTGFDRTGVLIHGYVPESQLDKLHPDESVSSNDADVQRKYYDSGKHYKDALVSRYSSGASREVLGAPVYLEDEWSTDHLETVLVGKQKLAKDELEDPAALAVAIERGNDDEAS